MERRKKLVRMNELLVVAILATAILSSGVSRAANNCPRVCECKWKNGKRSVECRSRGQISIPDNIDPETQVLDLSDNNLQILPREVFSRHGLLNLQKLKLSHCKIGQIDPTAFRGLTNLVELDLSGNLLTAIPTPTFSDVPYLRELALNNNPIYKVENSAFEMVPQLVTLDLSGCQIKKIASRGFSNIVRLERLYLHNNKLTQLRENIVESFQHLHSVTLHDNAWDCDCKLQNLIDWIVRSNIPMTEQPKCSQPRRIQGARFGNLALEDFACLPEFLPSVQYVDGNLDGEGRLSCRVAGIPSPTVSWSRAGEVISNKSQVDRGDSKFSILETGKMDKRSVLLVNLLEDEDAGEYICSAENRAGRVERNFTLRVGRASGVGGLTGGEISGIVFTILLLIFIVVLIVLVIILKIKPLLLRGSKSSSLRVNSTSTTTTNGLTSINQNGSTNGLNGQAGQGYGIVQHQSSFVSMETKLRNDSKYTTGEMSPNGSLRINGTLYSPATNGGTVNNGYINPDVIPIHTENTVGSTSSSNDSTHSKEKNGILGSLKRLKRKQMSESSSDDRSEEMHQNMLNGMALSQQNLNTLDYCQVAHAQDLAREFSPIPSHKNRYQNFPPPVSSVGVSSNSYNRMTPELARRQNLISREALVSPILTRQRNSPLSRTLTGHHNSLPLPELAVNFNTSTSQLTTTLAANDNYNRNGQLSGAANGCGDFGTYLNSLQPADRLSGHHLAGLDYLDAAMTGSQGSPRGFRSGPGPSWHQVRNSVHVDDYHKRTTAVTNNTNNNNNNGGGFVGYGSVNSMSMGMDGDGHLASSAAVSGYATLGPDMGGSRSQRLRYFGFGGDDPANEELGSTGIMGSGSSYAADNGVAKVRDWRDQAVDQFRDSLLRPSSMSGFVYGTLPRGQSSSSSNQYRSSQNSSLPVPDWLMPHNGIGATNSGPANQNSSNWPRANGSSQLSRSSNNSCQLSQHQLLPTTDLTSSPNLAYRERIQINPLLSTLEEEDGDSSAFTSPTEYNSQQSHRSVLSIGENGVQIHPMQRSHDPLNNSGQKVLESTLISRESPDEGIQTDGGGTDS